MRLFPGLPTHWTADVSTLECDARGCRRRVATTTDGLPRGWREHEDGRVQCGPCFRDARRGRKLAAQPVEAR